MVRPGTVIAQRFGAVGAQENGASMADFAQQVLGVTGRDFQVFRRDMVADLTGLVQIADVDQGTATRQAATDDVRAWHGGEQTFDGRFNLVQEVRIGTQQDGLGQLVVFSLGEQVHRHPVSRSTAVADDQDFGGAGNHVDANDAKDAAFGSGDIGVAGADNLVYRRDGVRTVSQSAYSLRATSSEHANDTAQGGSRQHAGVANS